MYFDSQNGWIQLVFANEQDTYYLPSLVQADYTQYLYYCLKKAGYEAVFFWKEEDYEIRLTLSDDETVQYYNKKIQPWGDKIRNKLLSVLELDQEENQGAWPTVTLSREDAAEDVFYDILEGKKKAALVIPLVLFERFFSTEDRMAELLDVKAEFKTLRSLVLLCASPCAEDSNRYLTKKEGVVYNLFEEVRQAASSDARLNFYTLMHEYMGEKCVFLNDLPRSLIRSVVWKHFVFGEEKEEAIRYLDEIVDVIDWYYHSEAFRRETPILFPTNHKRELRVIKKALQNARTREGILSWIEHVSEDKTPEEFQRYLQMTYQREPYQELVYSDSFLLSQWERVKLPENTPSKYQEDWTARMEECTERLKALIFRGGEATEKNRLGKCVEQLKKSSGQGDPQTFRYGLDAMQYLLESWDVQAEVQSVVREDNWLFFTNIFELSEEIRKLLREVKKYKLQIVENQEILKKLIQRVDLMERAGNSEEDGGELDVLRQRALQYDSEIEQGNMVCTIKNNQVFQYQQAISVLVKAIESSERDGTADVERVLKKAHAYREKGFQQGFEEVQALGKLSSSKKDTFLREKETGVGMSVQEIEQKYQDLAEKMHNLT